MDDSRQINEEEVQQVYEWVDKVPLSRGKKNIARDFADGVLIAEVIKHHVPKIIEVHNYPPASSVTLKNTNWITLNRTSVFYFRKGL
jgi:hypothetical protein